MVCLVFGLLLPLDVFTIDNDTAADRLNGEQKTRKETSITNPDNPNIRNAKGNAKERNGNTK